MQAGELWHAVPDLHPGQVPLGDGSGVLHEADGNGRAHFTIMGKNRQVAIDLGSIPATAQGQISLDAATSTAVAFVYNPGNGQEAQDIWQMYLWTAVNRQLRMVAANATGPDGQPFHGGWVNPVLTSQYLYWIQASANTSGWGGSSLMQYDLATGATRRLYAGLAEALVPYKSTVLFTAIVPGTPPPTPNQTSNGPPEQMEAVDQVTGMPVAAPVGITAATDAANDIITDGNMIIWNTWEGGLRAWEPAWGRSVTLLPNIDSNWPEIQKLGLSDATVPRIYGHFLVFNPGETTVLDLRTNSFAEVVNTPDSEDVTGPWMAIQAYTTQNSYDRATNIGTYDQYMVNLSQLPDLPSCSK